MLHHKYLNNNKVNFEKMVFIRNVQVDNDQEKAQSE